MWIDDLWLRKSGKETFNRNEITWKNQGGTLINHDDDGHLSYIFFHRHLLETFGFLPSSMIWRPIGVRFGRARGANPRLFDVRFTHEKKASSKQVFERRRCWIHDENMITWEYFIINHYHYDIVLISAWKLTSAKRSENHRTGTGPPSDRRCLHPFLQWTMQMILSDWQLRQKIVIATRWRRFVAGGSSHLQILEPLQDGWKAADSLHF